MGSTLSLKRGGPVVDETPEHGPAFDPDAHYGEVAGLEPAKYIQGKCLFNNAKQYVGVAEKHMWLTPLSKEQENARKVQLLKNKKFFGSAKPIALGSAIPDAVIQAQRENSKALAAERHAE